MTKNEIIELYLSDLKNIVKQSSARDNRIKTLKRELTIPLISCETCRYMNDGDCLSKNDCVNFDKWKPAIQHIKKQY